MDQPMVIDRLNDLLEAEARSLLRRLREAQPFVDWADADAVPVFERIVADEYEHQRQLCETIVALRGVPRPPILDMRTAGFHYLSARYLLPRVIDDQRARVAAYGKALAEATGSAEASALVTKLHARHQSHLEQLETLAERFANTEATQPEPVPQGDEA